MGRPKKRPDKPNLYHYLPGNVGYTRTQLEQFLYDGPEKFFAECEHNLDSAMIGACICAARRIKPPDWAIDFLLGAALDLLEGVDPYHCLWLTWLDDRWKRPPNKRLTRSARRHEAMALGVEELLEERPHLSKGSVYDRIGEAFGASVKQVQRAHREYVNARKTLTP